MQREESKAESADNTIDMPNRLKAFWDHQLDRIKEHAERETKAHSPSDGEFPLRQAELSDSTNHS